MSLLNEDLMKTSLDLPDGEIEIIAAADPVYADAIEVHEKKKEQVEDALKEQNKLADEFVKETSKKMELSESLFEDYNEDPATYNDIFNVLDNIQHLVDDTMNWSDEEWTKENINKTSDMLEEEVRSLNRFIVKLPGGAIKEATAVLDRPINRSKRFKDQEFSTDFYYKTTRDPLAEIIQDELTCGEVVYRESNGKLNPTWTPSLNLNYEDIGASTDDNGDYIIANIANEATVKQVEAIGSKYNREVKSGYDKYVSDTPYWVKIYLEDGDWDEPYFDPNVKTRKDYK